MNKSNPVLFEWLKSPIIYKKNQKFFDIFTRISGEYFSPLATIYHYLHMATRNYKEYLKADLVKTKKYFYALRPLLSCKWVEMKNSAPPLEFEILLDELVSDEIVKSEIKILLERKRSGYEFAEEKKIQCLNDFIESKFKNFTD